MLIDALIFGIPMTLLILWLWPEEKAPDPYDNPDHWGEQ
jgi:hypothetical protein